MNIWRLLEEPVEGYTEVSHTVGGGGRNSSSRKSCPVTDEAVGDAERKTFAVEGVGDGEGNGSSIEHVIRDVVGDGVWKRSSTVTVDASCPKVGV